MLNCVNRQNSGLEQGKDSDGRKRRHLQRRTKKNSESGALLDSFSETHEHSVWRLIPSVTFHLSNYTLPILHFI
jgi:hypothetical protein